MKLSFILILSFWSYQKGSRARETWKICLEILVVFDLNNPHIWVYFLPLKLVKWKSCFHIAQVYSSHNINVSPSVQFSSVARSCPALCDPVDCGTPGFPVHHQLRSFLKLLSIELVMPCNHLTLCHLLLLPPSIFPSIRVFSSESVLRMRWPKYWSFSFSIKSPSVISNKR